MLEVNDLSAGYQGNDVVYDVNFRVNQGEAVMIIGSNGAGKTTLFQALCGLLSPSSGKVLFEGNDITGIPAERIARLGMRFVSAVRHLFPRMTVEEHLLLGAYPHKPDPETMSIVLDLFPRLAERRRQRAGTMSGGEQQMLAVGRALMSNPRLLVLDEPSTGLAPLLARAAYEATCCSPIRTTTGSIAGRRLMERSRCIARKAATRVQTSATTANRDRMASRLISMVV